MRWNLWPARSVRRRQCSLSSRDESRSRIGSSPYRLRGLLYCYYRGIHGSRTITRTLQDESVWPMCGFDRAAETGDWSWGV